MKKRFAMALLAGILGAIVSAQWTQAANEGMQATNAVFVPASDMKFIDVPGFPGLQTAVAEGDPAKGPLTQEGNIPKGTRFSALQATEQLWQPIQRRRSIAMTYLFFSTAFFFISDRIQSIF